MLTIQGCLTTVKRINNKLIQEGTIIEQGNSSKQIVYHFKKVKYVDNMIDNLAGLNQGEMFEIIIDSLKPFKNIILFYKPILGDTNNYYKDSVVILEKNLQYYPIFKIKLFYVRYSFYYKGYNLKSLIRSEYIECNEKSMFLKYLEKGDKIEALFSKNRPEVCYLNLR